jgi:hypothetical protein
MYSYKMMHLCSGFGGANIVGWAIDQMLFHRLPEEHTRTKFE